MKDDRENLGDDLGQRQCQFLLELSSALQDRVLPPGIEFARMIKSNDVISDMIILFSFFAHSISPTCDRPAGDKKLAERSEVSYVHHVPA